MRWQLSGQTGPDGAPTVIMARTQSPFRNVSPQIAIAFALKLGRLVTPLLCISGLSDKKRQLGNATHLDVHIAPSLGYAMSGSGLGQYPGSGLPGGPLIGRICIAPFDGEAR